jgi:hypothetical protein
MAKPAPTGADNPITLVAISFAVLVVSIVVKVLASAYLEHSVPKH